jgi:2-polyprenyl-6-hydroxyphenyl methylase/3-demethylubiquinone-9 3-methyltransferase
MGYFMLSSWSDRQPAGSHRYLTPCVCDIVGRHLSSPAKIIDLGCGHGAMAMDIARLGHFVIGVDLNRDGIAYAKAAYPDLQFQIASVYDDLRAQLGQFACVVSCEVIEHLYSPHRYAQRIFDLLEPGGIAVISTPYHSYLKNMALSAAGKWDYHHHPLREHGHIKFWSKQTLVNLMAESGLRLVEFHRLGRVPPLAKSMLAVFEKPDAVTH